jgi:pyruvate formate lyase activating enzyme
MKGIVFDIRHFSVNDGPGLRTTVFLKGCPLSCPWCHNPEGINTAIEKFTRQQSINGFLRETDEMSGTDLDVLEVIAEIEKSRIFFEESNGGATFSGGEPLLQPEFLLACLKACQKAGIHTTIDTSGYADAKVFQAILPYTDLFLFDLKHLDDESHFKSTGVHLEPILINLETAAAKKPVIIRIPLIPGYNDSQSVLNEMGNFISRFPSIKQIDLLPYHFYAKSKYLRMKISYLMSEIKEHTESQIKTISEIFNKKGFQVTIGG